MYSPGESLRGHRESRGKTIEEMADATGIRLERVLGGSSGERIRHVWMRDGRIEQSIRLPLGASTWRTHSTKTIGRPGAWAVEAQDEQGNVLARVEFTCAP